MAEYSYSWQSTDNNRKRQYTKLKKRVFQTTSCSILKKRTNKRTTSTLSYFFVPFRGESSLLLENETAEEAFHRLINEDSSAYRDKLQKILDAQSETAKIKEARKADGEEEGQQG